MMWRGLLLFAATLLLACGSGDDTSTFDAGNGQDVTQPDAGPTFTITVDPPQAAVTVTLGQPPGTTTYRAFRVENGAQTDVTAQVTWSIGNASVGSVAGGVVALAGIGGATNVTASMGGASGQAGLSVKLTGDVFLGGADSGAKQQLNGATQDPDPKNAPSLEYPEDRTVLPANLPPVEMQWSQASDNDTYRVHMTAPTLDVSLYTKDRQVLLDAPTWNLVRASSPDLPGATTWVVDATGPSKLLRTSAPRAFSVTSDTIDDASIYVWQSSTGSFHVIDVAAGKDFPLPNDAPALQQGQPCSGCHRISRDGKRFAYTYNGGNFEFGTLAFDANAKQFTGKIQPSLSFRGTYAAFNPLESKQKPAMLVSVPDVVAQNTAGTVRLEMHDPDTNAVVPSNVAAMIGQLGKPPPGQATLMPDWSADGSFVVFAAYDSTTAYVRDLGDDIVRASIVEAPVSYDGTQFTFGAPKVLVGADPNANPDTADNNFLPAISPDGSAVAFTRAAGWWSIKTQQSLINLSGQIMLVRRSDGQVFELKNGSNGAGTTLSSTWPQWAPTMGARYAWLAYSSERPYGHEVTVANHSCGGLVQGQESCKQLWVIPVDLDKLKSGNVDPSYAPFWIPGQDIHAQYVSPQWTKAVLTPPN